MFTYPNALFLASTNQLHVFVGFFHFHNLGFAWNQHCYCSADRTGVGHGGQLHLGAIALPKDNLSPNSFRSLFWSRLPHFPWKCKSWTGKLLKIWSSNPHFRRSKKLCSYFFFFQILYKKLGSFEFNHFLISCLIN